MKTYRDILESSFFDVSKFDKEAKKVKGWKYESDDGSGQVEFWKELRGSDLQLAVAFTDQNKYDVKIWDEDRGGFLKKPSTSGKFSDISELKSILQKAISFAKKSYDIEESVETVKSVELSEKKDLSQFADTIAKMTDRNDHMAARLLAAELTGEKRLVEVVKAINNIIDFEGHNPISDYVYQIYKKIMKAGERKYGDDWTTYIRSNM